MFLAGLYIALFIFALGFLYKLSSWFHCRLDPSDTKMTAAKRLFSALKGMASILLSAKVLILVKVFVLDILLQIRVLKEDFLRWAMHMLIYWGFLLLFLMHALESLISESLFAGYYSTVNPFLFLRDLFGIMVVLGIGIALYRRFFQKSPRLSTSAMDHYAIAVLALIMMSGFLLEGIKITSHQAFVQMQEDYAGLEDASEIRALESYWVQHFGIASPNVKKPFKKNLLSQGEELHAESCIECHSRPYAAFAGYAVSRILYPVAIELDRAGAVDVLWHIHFLLCFIGLAYLPFSKMFHIVAGPLSLLANSVMDPKKSDRANIATRQILELDACTHCGACSTRCSVGIAFEELSNINILPSEKLNSIKSLISGKKPDDRKLKLLLEGLYLCTNCHRCTVICPVGINLQELWFKVRETLLERGFSEMLMLSPLSLYRGLKGELIPTDRYERPLQRIQKALSERFRLKNVRNNTLTPAHLSPALKRKLGLSFQAKTFANCFNCKTCTLSCPVVKTFADPRSDLGLEPHQIIHCLLLGIGDLAFGSHMLWTCLGCYQCQENCPQGVQVTDIFYELKNLAILEFQKNPVF